MTRLLLFVIVIASGCVRSGIDHCSVDSDCFAGEMCSDARCIPATSPATNATTTRSCDLSECESELTADVQCRGTQCVVLSCEPGATLCDGGCCAIEAPPDGTALTDVQSQSMDVELDPHGFPDLVWLDVDSVEIYETRWTGQAWESDRVTPLPNPFAFDLEYHDDVRTLTYLEALNGDVYHARQNADGSWASTKVMDAPVPLDLDNPRFFFRFHSAGRGDNRVVCAIFGNVDAADSSAPNGELPDLYVARWNSNRWDAELLEGDDSVRQTCSVGIDSLGQPHVAYAVVVDGTAFIRHAHVSAGQSEWEISEDPDRVGIITNNEAMQLRDDGVHIFSGLRLVDENDDVFAGIIDYIRDPAGGWSEQIVHQLAASGPQLGVSDASTADGRIELIVSYFDPANSQLSGGRLFSTQPGTWGALQLFEEQGNLFDIAVAAGDDRTHIFTQSSSTLMQWDYFSLEAP